MRRGFAFGAVVIFLVVGTGCGDPPAPSKVEPLDSRVELAAGDVWLQVNGSKDRVISGAMLIDGSLLSVGTGGRAMVRLGNGTRVFMNADTEILLTGGNLELKQGEIWADVPDDDTRLSSFKAGKSTITAGNAAFDLAVQEAGTTIYVARGLAVFDSEGGRVEVQTGQKGTEVKGGAPTIEPVDFWEDWTGGMADRGISASGVGKAGGRIYGIDRRNPGKRPTELQISSQKVRVYIREGVAHTTVDQRFFNPAGEDLEGYYWFTIPEGAAVERFAMEVNGELVEGQVIERKQAAAAYEEAVRKAFDPALLEWVDGRTFRARIFPIPAAGERRVVLSYTELLPMVEDVYRYLYPMGGEGEVEIQEFSLRVDLGDEGEDYRVSTLQDARIEEDRTAVTMRRSGYVPRSDFLLELERKEAVEPMQVFRYSADGDQADYVMLRYSPEVDWSAVKRVQGDVVVVLDTSAGGDDAARQTRVDTTEAVLRAMAKGDRFAVVVADLTSRQIYPETGLAEVNDEAISSAMEAITEVSSAGASDLGSMFNEALALVHDAEQPAVVYIGDGRPTVGETGHDDLAGRLRRSMGDSRARLFTIAVGDDANHALLNRLARTGGGRSFRINSPQQAVQEALRFAGAVKTPTITELELNVGAGLDQVFSTAAGKISEGEEVILMARTHHGLPDEIVVKGRLGGEPFERKYKTDEQKDQDKGYIPSMWARLYLERLMGEGLEDNRGTIISLGLNHGLMTPFSSFLVLENNAAYEAQGIKRRSRPSYWSQLDADLNSVEVGELARTAAALPLLPLGCGRLDREDDGEASMEEVPDWLKKDKTYEAPGGKGKRHKGEEGQMGMRDSAKSDNHYGIRGPKDSPEPQMARSASERRAEIEEQLASSGVNKILGTLSADQNEAIADVLKGGDVAGDGEMGFGGLGIVGTGRGGGGSGSGYGRGAGGLAGRRADVPVVKTGAAQVVRGSLSKEIIRRIVRRHINEVKFCYERVLPDKPGLSGDLSVRFVIDESGQVISANISDNTLVFPRVEQCVVRAIKRWRFPQPEGGKVIVDYPFRFKAPGKEEPKPTRIAVGNPYGTGNPKSPFKTSVCSDASKASFFQRRILWKKRLAKASGPSQLARIFFEAGKRCELERWRDRKALLDMIEVRVSTASDVTTLLDAFGSYPVFKKYLARKILKRALDPEIAYRLWSGSGIDWASVRSGLAALKTDADRVEKVRELLKGAPDDPVGRALLARMLYNDGQTQEAMAVASRLKRDGQAGVAVVRLLCDMQAEAGLAEAAKRSCSEMVEYNPEDPGQAQAGESFVRHGWFESAYRQFKTLVESGPADPIAMLRMAAAAAGMGKTDEALRLERKVASMEGEPGPTDPRTWARLLSASRLSEMILSAKKANEEKKIKALTRELKRTQAFDQAATYKILVWRDVEAPLMLKAKVEKEDYPLSGSIYGVPVGMHMIDLGTRAPEGLTISVEPSTLPFRRSVAFTVYTIVYDGKDFSVSQTDGELPSLAQTMEI